jgi:hypothetical protein
MFKRNSIAFYILIISTVLINKCIRNKTLTENDYTIYIESWADTLCVCGIGVPNIDLEPAAQRAGAVRAAKIESYRVILDSIYVLPISNTKIINDLIIENNEVEMQIEEYARGIKTTEVIYLESGNIEVWGCIPTDDIKTIILPYL